ncbi:MAG: hypothetical protein KGI25_03955 [Thaumarchaeota archaeon]|nr:hypothetical protein [Nitrososphaerota archaeon]
MILNKLMNQRDAEVLIRDTMSKIKSHEIELHQGCVACHVIFTLKQKSGRSEQDAADLLSNVLTHDPKLNSEFIEVVEQVHMKERNMGGAFATRERESKDNYLEAYFSNVLDELTSDLNFASYQVILRKLLLSYLGLYLAQTIGVDYHAATEELYYLLRKDDVKNSKIAHLIAKFEEKIKQNDKNSYSH